MSDLGSGIAIAGLAVSGGAVIITAIRTYSAKKNGNGCLPCKEHTGVIACLENIEKGQDRHEDWLKEIAADMKILLRDHA